jgi:hypothetical protein
MKLGIGLRQAFLTGAVSADRCGCEETQRHNVSGAFPYRGNRRKSLDRPPAKAAVQNDYRASEAQTADPIAFFG